MIVYPFELVKDETFLRYSSYFTIPQCTLIYIDLPILYF